MLDKVGKKQYFLTKISIGGNEAALVELQQEIEDRFAGKSEHLYLGKGVPRHYAS
ncbi:hypothetical protein GCM10020331_042770 [Ectobacillus funiculus]